MKILVVTPYKNAYGGVETVTGILESVLQKNQITVDYLTAEIADDCTLWLKLQMKLWGLPAVTMDRYKKINIEQYDAVICNGEFGFGIHHPRAINYFHGSYLGLKKMKCSCGPKAFLALSLRSWQQQYSSRGKTVVSVSEFLNEILSEQKIRVSHTLLNPVNLEIFKPDKTLKKSGDFIFAGRGDYFSKGFDILEKLAERGHDITCFTDLKRTLGPVKIKPMLPYTEMPAVYNQYRVLLFTSRFESFGMAAAEAMACGLPIIMTDTGLARRLKNEIPEFVLKNAEDLSEIEARMELLKNNYEEYSLKARSFCEKHLSIEKYTHEWMRILHADMEY